MSIILWVEGLSYEITKRLEINNLMNERKLKSGRKAIHWGSSSHPSLLLLLHQFSVVGSALTFTQQLEAHFKRTMQLEKVLSSLLKWNLSLSSRPSFLAKSRVSGAFQLCDTEVVTEYPLPVSLPR